MYMCVYIHTPPRNQYPHFCVVSEVIASHIYFPISFQSQQNLVPRFALTELYFLK